MKLILKNVPPFIPPKNKKPSVNLRYRGFKVPRTDITKCFILNLI